ELKARGKRWDEKHLDALRLRKDKLFDEYKEQQKKKKIAQLQQLESRLRYSRTDKETAEEKLRILMDKELVGFQSKLDYYE
ncbi:unnamed protein product, partial [Rotaria magnacalcarata]